MAAKGREIKASAEFVACVVGLSRGDGEAFSSYSGAGKSCLCYRFVYPGFDDYVDNHQSILALHEFESQVINRDHFLYWGSVFKHFPVKGSKTGPYAIIQVHVIEQTVLYQDETSQPFPNFGNYHKRIIGSLESPGKVSYKSRDDLDRSSDAQQYPSKKLSKLPKGYMVVLDVSLIGDMFNAQLKRTEQMLDYLTKHKQKFIIVTSKRDNSNPNSVRCAQELKQKYHAILVETSAGGNINIRDAFRLLAHKVLKKPDISDSIKSFEGAQQKALQARSYAKRAFQEFLEEQVVDPKEQLHHLNKSSEFRECKKLTGKFDTGWLFATHILQLCNEEYSNKETTQVVSRREYLEQFIKEQPDLSTYSHHLKSWIEFYISEDQADTSDVHEQREEDTTETSVAATKTEGHPECNTHAWVTLIDGTPPTEKGRYSSMASNETTSQTSDSICSAKSNQESISISSDDAILDIDPQTSPTRYTNYNSSVRSVDDIGSTSSVNNENRLCATDRERLAGSNEYLGYETIDDLQPDIHHNEPTSTHKSGQRPPAKVKANTGKELVPLVAKVPASGTTIKQPTCTTPQQRTLLNMATPSRYDYENHTLNLQQGSDKVSLPPRSRTTVHAHGSPVSPLVSSPPRQEVVFERKNFKRLDTPRTLLAKKLGMLEELSKTQNPVLHTVTEHSKEYVLPNTATQRCDYENHTLPFEHKNEEISRASFPPRSQTTTHTRTVRSPPPMASSPPGQKTGVMERKDINPLDTPRTLLAMKSKSRETLQKNEDTVISTPDSTDTAEQPEVKEPHIRHNYENHSLKFEHQNKAADHVSLPPRSLTATHAHKKPLAQSVNNAPRQDEPAAVGERTDFSRLATPNTLKRFATQQSGKPTSPTPDYVDEDYINTTLLSVSGLSSPDYVDEDYINTALISQSDQCISPPSASILGMVTVTQADHVDEADYVNTTPPTTVIRGTRPLPLGEGGDKDGDLVYDYPDLRNSRLLRFPQSHKIHRPLHSIKSDPLGNSRDAPIPPRRTKRRAKSDALHTQHLTTTTQVVASVSNRLSDGIMRESSLDSKSMNVSSTIISQQASLPDYVSGYVNTEIERPLPSRKVNEEEGSDEELDYDYPNIERTIRFNFGAPHQKSQKKLAILPPRKGTTTFSSTSSQTTSSKSGNKTSNVNTSLPKWWLQLIEERERRRNNPDLYVHFATGRQRNSQLAAILPPRQNLHTSHDQITSLCENSELLGIDTDEYIVMASAGCTVDDNYINWETIYNAREYLSPHTGHSTSSHKALPPRKGLSKDAKSIRHRKYSVDDMQVAYVVTNTPPQKPAALPPRGVLRTIPDESKSECDSKEKRSSVTEAPQVKPQVKPKPTGLTAKQKNETLSQCHSNDSKISELNKPKPKPKPKVPIRPKPKIGASTKPPLTRTVSPQGGEQKIQGQAQQTIGQLQHQDTPLSLDCPTRLPVPPRSRPSRFSDQSAPSEVALSTAK